jgi:hypothetical protein
MWQAGLLDYDNEKGIDWEWQAIDGAMTKAPLGGAGTGANPTDRGKKGTKRSLLTDAKGIPLSIVTDGANRHDKMLLKIRCHNFRKTFSRRGNSKYMYG